MRPGRRELDGASLVNYWPTQHRNAQDFKSAPVTLKLLSLNLSLFLPLSLRLFPPCIYESFMSLLFFFFFPLRGSFRKKEKEEKKGIKIYTHKALPVLMFLLLCVAYYHRCWTNYLLDVCNVLPSLRAMLLMGQLFGFQC